MKYVAILSCERSGTHFTAQAVQTMGKITLPWAQRGMWGFIQHVYPEGVEPEADALIQEAWDRDDAVIVVPMRHPVLSLISNYEHRRGSDRTPGLNPLEKFARAFGRVAGWDDAFFFQVDVDDHDFEGLANHIGVNWAQCPKPSSQPANVTPSRVHSRLRSWFHNNEWDKIDKELDGAVSILREYADFFDRFGYERW